MAVTEKNILHILILLLAGMMSGCAVENSASSPGTVECKPTLAELNVFYPSVALSMTNMACTFCHGDPTYTRNSGFKLPPQTPTTAVTAGDADLVKKTSFYCSVYRNADRIKTYVPTEKHPGAIAAQDTGNYTNLMNWILIIGR